LYLRMPRTIADKYKLGLLYISKLSLSHQCRSFSGGVTNCKCICNCQDKLPQVNFFFERKIKEFWHIPSHLSVMNEAVAVGKLFGTYLYPHSTFESEQAGYIFNIDEEDMEFCLPTMVLAKMLALLPGLS